MRPPPTSDRCLYDPPWGRELLRRAAEQGYVPAQMTLGAYFLSGLSTPHDPAVALYRFRQAAYQREPEATIVIGDVERNGYNVDQPHGKAAKVIVKWLYD